MLKKTISFKTEAEEAVSVTAENSKIILGYDNTFATVEMTPEEALEVSNALREQAFYANPDLLEDEEEYEDMTEAMGPITKEEMEGFTNDSVARLVKTTNELANLAGLDIEVVIQKKEETEDEKPEAKLPGQEEVEEALDNLKM